MRLQRFWIKQEVEVEESQEVQFRTEVTGGSNVPVFCFLCFLPVLGRRHADLQVQTAGLWKFKEQQKGRYTEG